jgi:hypothetical protein
MRGKEKHSLLIAARANLVNKMTLKKWTKRHDGTFGTKQMDAFSRILIVELEFEQPVGRLGTNIAFCNVHLHHDTAKRVQRCASFFAELAECLQEHNVTFLGGDFNMAFTQVVPIFRSCGLAINLAAWYPWKSTADGSFGFDSMGIFVIHKAAIVIPHFTMEDLNFWDSTITMDEYDAIRAPPGQLASSYRPQSNTFRQHMEGMLTQAPAVAELVQRHGTKLDGSADCLKCKEKRLDKRLWMVNNTNPYGAHFPLVTFTKQGSHRSAERVYARRGRNYAGRGGARGGARNNDRAWNNDRGWNNSGWSDTWNNDRGWW